MADTERVPEEMALAKERAPDRTTVMTRRQLLSGTGQIALLAMLPLACAPVVSKPWADGTFWDDGQGWTA